MKHLIIASLLALAMVGCQPPEPPVDPCDHEAQNHAQGLVDCPDVSQHSHMQEAEEDHGDEEAHEESDEHHDE